MHFGGLVLRRRVGSRLVNPAPSAMQFLHNLLVRGQGDKGIPVYRPRLTRHTFARQVKQIRTRLVDEPPEDRPH